MQMTEQKRKEKERKGKGGKQRRKREGRIKERGTKWRRALQELEASN